MASPSEILLEQGRQAAEAARQRGAISARMWSDLGQIGTGAVDAYRQQIADRPRQQLQAVQLQGAQDEQAAATAEREREARLSALFQSGKRPTIDDVSAIMGPERGAKIVGALDALDAAHTKKYTDKAEVIAKTLAGLDATPETLRASVYPGIRQTLIGAGVIGEQDAPAQYDATWFQQARNFGQAPTKPESGFTLNPGDVRFSQDGKQIAAVPTAEKPEEGAYVTVKGPGGRPVRQWVPKTKLAEGVEEYREPQAPRAPEPLESIIGPNGQPVLVPRSQAVGKMPATSREKPTEDERKTAGFYSQMRDAISTIDQVEPSITEKELYQIQTLPQEGLIGMINRGELSEAAKRYVRAFEQFTESRLRPVSGAAIADTEYARDRRTYAKQFGETPKLNEDRTRARNLALDSLGTRAGVLKPKGGDQPPPAQVTPQNIVTTPPPDSSGTWKWDGKAWVKK